MYNILQFRSSLSLAIFAFCVASAPAATLEYQAVFGAPIYSFDSSSFSYTSFELTGPAPTLTGTLNPGDQFRIVYSAPSGSLFSIFPKPIGSSSFGFFADFWTTGGVNLPTDSAGTSVSFVGASGPAPIPSELQFSFGLPGEMHALAVFEVEDFSFKSIIATFTVPVGYSDTFTNFSPAVIRLNAYSMSSIDTGAFASLIPDPNANVPEPASLLLVSTAMGLVALLGSKRLRS